MYRIRFHGRGGQGMKTAANILGTAFFDAGFEVQDAPRYGAERRGAPMFAYVRAGRAPIVERGAIGCPDLVLVADPSLLAISAAGVMQGADARTVLFVNVAEPAERIRVSLGYPGRVLTWADATGAPALAGTAPASAACAGAAARLVGSIARDSLECALIAQVATRSTGTDGSRALGLAAYDAFAAHAGVVREDGAQANAATSTLDWIQLAPEAARLAVPSIFTPATSDAARTGAWRVHRPVIDYGHCNRCSWVCSTLCPDSAIRVDAERTPHIDYDHCKGCLVCVVACPPHAIRVVPEREANASGAAQ